MQLLYKTDGTNHRNSFLTTIPLFSGKKNVRTFYDLQLTFNSIYITRFGTTNKTMTFGYISSLAEYFLKILELSWLDSEP